MITGKTIALTRRTFVGKVMSLILNMLSRLVITVLPRSKISRLQSPSAVILEPTIVVCHCFHCFAIQLSWSNGTRCHDLHFLNVEFKPGFLYSSITFIKLSSVQFISVAQLCPTPCSPMICCTPGLPVHHWLLEFTQTHVHWVGDAIQPSHPLSSPSPLAPNPSQHQGLFEWVSSSHEVAKGM